MYHLGNSGDGETAYRGFKSKNFSLEHIYYKYQSTETTTGCGWPSYYGTPDGDGGPTLED